MGSGTEAQYERFQDFSNDTPVQGFLHRPRSSAENGLVLTHGAGGNATMPLLVTLAEAFAGAGFTVLRVDLPFRQSRRFGPPRPGDAAHDRDGIRCAIAALRKMILHRVFVGGQSYGGRQASTLLADDPVADGPIADGLLLLSYPLHAPSRPDQPRTQHLPNLRVPTLFVHGTRDPFGTIDEIEAARKLIPAETDLQVVEGAGHDLGFKGKSRRADLPNLVLEKFRALMLKTVT